MSVAVGAGGWVSVAAGIDVLVGGTGVFVGAIDVLVGRIGVFVGAIGVFVGRIGVFVEGGLVVGAAGVEVLMPVGSGSGSLSRAVALVKTVAVGVEVRVLVGVAVVMVEVGVGTREGVDVGTVAVGNGPSKAFAVWAIEVFVLAACPAASRPPRHGFPNRVT
jgi:hypothetical protein